MTLGSLFKKPETLRYPAETKPPYAGQKGHVVNRVEDCILCSKCQKVCPCHCITVDKAARTWTIDPYLCIQCSSCIDACPKDCLSMDPAATPIASSKHDITLSIPETEKS